LPLSLQFLYLILELFWQCDDFCVSCYCRMWFQTRWFLCEFPIGSYVKLSSVVQSSWSEGGTTRHNFGRGPSNDYFIKVWFQLSNWFQTRRFLCEFPIGSYVKLSLAVGAILVERQTLIK
jgi:hypothetical protein